MELNLYYNGAESILYLCVTASKIIIQLHYNNYNITLTHRHDTGSTDEYTAARSLLSARSLLAARQI